MDKVLGHLAYAQRMADVAAARAHPLCRELGAGWVMVGPIDNDGVTEAYQFLHSSGSFADRVRLDVCMPAELGGRVLMEALEEMKQQEKMVIRESEA